MARRAIGVLYRGIPDDNDNDNDNHSCPILTRSELEQLQVKGAPVFIEHDYSMNAVGKIIDSWIDDKCQLWIATELLPESELGKPLSDALASAIKNGYLKDFSIGLDAVRIHKGKKIKPRWIEASLVSEGKYDGTHIMVRGSTVNEYIDSRTNHNSELKIYKMDSTTNQQEEQIAQRHADLARLTEDQQSQIVEMQKALKAYQEKEQKELDRYRESQQPVLDEYVDFAKSLGVNVDEFKQIANELVKVPDNDVWKTISAALHQNKELKSKLGESDERVRKLNEHLEQQQQEISVRASKRARVDEMFKEKRGGSDEVGEEEGKGGESGSVWFPDSLSARDPQYWSRLLERSRKESGTGQPTGLKHFAGRNFAEERVKNSFNGDVE